MKNRLQLRYHIENPLPTREEAINYINNIFYNDANDGLTSLIAEPLVVFYNNDTTLKNRRLSIETANVILAIGRGGDGTNVEKNKDYFIIDFAKNVEDIYKINEIIGDVNDDKSKSSIYGLIAKNSESIENEINRAKEVENSLFQSIEDAKNQLLSEIINNKKDINDEKTRAIGVESDLIIKISEEYSRATQAEKEILEELNDTKISLEKQITKNKVISSNKTITFNTNSSNTDISVNVDTDSIKIDEQTGRLSVKPEAFIKYDGENAIQINDKENYTKEISLIINQDDQILSNETNGLKSTLSLKYIKDDENKPLLALIGKNSEIISSINVSDFINDGMIESVKLEDVQGKKYLVITWNTAAGKDVSRLEVSSLIDVYTAGNGIKLNNGEFSIKLKTEQSLLKSGESGLYVDEEVLNTKIDNNTNNLIDNKITQRFYESKEYTDQQISEVEEDISYYISDLKGDIEASEKNAKNYADVLKIEINNDITNLTNKNSNLENSITSLNQEINIIESNITNTLESAKEYTDTKIEPLDVILNGYGTSEGKTTTVKTDIENLQGQIDAIHTHDNKEVLDGITTEKVQAWDDAEQNAKDYADNEIAKVVETLEGADNALDSRIQSIEGTLTEKETKWDDAVSKIDTFLTDADLTENAVDTLKELQEYIKSDGSAAKELISRVAANETILEGYGIGETATVKEHIDNVNRVLIEYQTKVGDIQTLNLTADEFKENKTFLITSGLYKTKDGILFCDSDNWQGGGIKLTHIKDGKVKTCYNTNTPSNSIDTDIIIWSDWADYYDDFINKINVNIDGLQERIDDIVKNEIGVWSDGVEDNPTVKGAIEENKANVLYTVNTLERALKGTDEDTKDSDSIKGAKKYTDEKIQEVIENIGTLNGDINTTKNGVQLINDVDKCGLLFTKGDKQRLITFDGIIERLFDYETNKWKNNWNDFVTWDNNLPTEPTIPEVSGETLDIKNNGTVSEQTLDIKNNGKVEDNILTINK